MGIVLIGTVFVDIKGFPEAAYIPTGRNVGRVEFIHGGVSRNVAEDIGNIDLRPTFVGMVDESPMGEAVRQNLINHKVNCDYLITTPDGLGMWLAVFDNNGDVSRIDACDLYTFDEENQLIEIESYCVSI